MNEPEGYELTGYSTSLEWAVNGIDTIAERFRVTAWPKDLRNEPDADIWSCTVTYRGNGQWSVDRGGLCLHRSGVWDANLAASDRGDEWLDGHRFTRDIALAMARKATLTIRIAGLTTMEAIAGHRKDDNGQAQQER